jgi:hypothetical protein
MVGHARQHHLVIFVCVKVSTQEQTVKYVKLLTINYRLYLTKHEDHIFNMTICLKSLI